MKIVVVVATLVAFASGRPEPPAPGYSTTQNDFMPPPANALSTSYGPPSGDYPAPSDTYGAPSGAFSVPSSTYGAPSRSSSSSSSRLGSRSSSRRSGLSRNNAAPAFTDAIFSSAPSSTYGAPAASSRVGGAPAPVYGPPTGGYNYDDSRARLAQDDLSEPANYDFSYGVQDAQSGSDFGHQESRQEDSAQGEYRVLLPDGRTLIVEYEANENGYQPNIRYEEPTGPYAASQRSQGGPY